MSQALTILSCSSGFIVCMRIEIFCSIDAEAVMIVLMTGDGRNYVAAQLKQAG